MEDLIAMVIILIVAVILIKLWKLVIFPKLVDKTIEEVERNPKWITSKLKANYYGFSNIDIITVKSLLGTLPRFRLVQKNAQTRIELLIPEDISVHDVDKIGALALRGKIYILYGINPPENKPTHWLAILLYMLDGGDIKEEAISWESKK